METEKEWHFVKNLTKNHQGRWFIGLKRVCGSHTWSWLSESVAWDNDSSTGTWRWSDGEPNNFEKENCTEIMKDGKYNNIKCQGDGYDDSPGYICEKQFSKFTIMPKLC